MMPRTIAVVAALATAPVLVNAPASATPPIFGPPVEYANGPLGGGESHRTLRAHDLDGNGSLDLAFTDTVASVVRIALNDGVGGYAAQATYPSGGTGPEGLDVADFDNDGDADLIVANTVTSNVAILLNDGAGHFGTAGVTTATLAPTNVLVGDFNGDGNIDVSAHGIPAVPGVTVWLGNGDGTLGAARVIPTGLVFVTSHEVGDLNGDGRLDMVAGDAALGFYPMFGRGDGTFKVGRLVSVPLGHEDLTMADVDGDGVEDVIVGEVGSNRVKTYLGRGDGTFRSPIASTVNLSAGLPPTFLVAVAAADFDQDGYLDLALSGGTDQRLYLMRGDGAGSFTTVETHDVGAVIRTIAVGDLDGDGRTDLAAAGSGEVDVFLS